MTFRPGTAWSNPDTGQTGGSASGPTSFNAFMKSGPIQGADPLQLCRDAIAFWRCYREEIDPRVAERQSAPPKA